MNISRVLSGSLVAVVLLPVLGLRAAESPAAVPRFSIAHMDRSVEPDVDFYRFAAGSWLKNNPVPPDKSRWSGFEQLRERNWQLLRDILETSTDPKMPRDKSRRQVGDFFAAAMDTNRLEQLRFQPIEPDLRRIAALKSTKAIFTLLADFHERGIGGMFGAGVSPDARNSSIYALGLHQGGLSLPDRDYYLKDEFAKQREAYLAHVTKMLTLLGEQPATAAVDAAIVLEIETALAKAGRSRVDLRDPVKNYNKFAKADLVSTNPALAWRAYLDEAGLSRVSYVIVGQPEFFAELERMVRARPLDDWKVYLRWHVLRAAAPYLHREVEDESFAFHGRILRGQPEPEPRWQRAAKTIDGTIGEALGRLYVEKYFPPPARVRMIELVANLRAVFVDRLKRLEWMSAETRAKGLAKFDRFTQKIGHPEHFRDYSKVSIRRDDLLGNIQRASRVESRREAARVGKPVDRLEWHMTPQTVNAYFNASQNEIVFPAGILQPPFFDLEMDDAVNYGAIGVVIGHEITHGYDDKGRQYDADGNLKDWWTAADAKEFEGRAQKLVDQYNSYEPIPGLKVNGKLTLGENIADLGGVTIAYEALQRALAKDPARRKLIDGFTPEQRFFISLAQLWRTNTRDEEARRLVTTDPHSPGQFRAIGPHVNVQEFYDAFGIQPGKPMYRPPELRARIW
ncbi:MAG: putative endopeptidase [Verrucomicrobiota bacterium]|jgi:putative endopeptidase